MQRRNILSGKSILNEKGELIEASKEKLEFIDEEDENMEEQQVPGEINPGEESNIVKIVTRNLIQKFGTDAKVLKQAMTILKKSENVPEETVQLVKEAYNILKEADYAAVLNQLHPQTLLMTTATPTNSQMEVTVQMLTKGLQKVDKISDNEQKKAVIAFYKSRAQHLLLKTVDAQDQAATEEESKGEIEGPSISALKTQCFTTLMQFHTLALKTIESGDNNEDDSDSSDNEDHEEEQFAMLHTLYKYGKSHCDVDIKR